MRFFTKHSAAAAVTELMPFGGLGFDTHGVLAAARMMVPATPRRHRDCQGTVPPTPECARPTGYKLLVSLGREIRGR